MKEMFEKQEGGLFPQAPFNHLWRKGPDTAFDDNGKPYITYGYTAPDETSCWEAFNLWCNDVEGKAVVWRAYPEVKQDELSWYIRWRCSIEQ